MSHPRTYLLALGAVACCLLTACATIRPYLPSNPFRRPATSRPVTRIAVLPFAYRGAEDRYACDLCPDRVIMDETSRDEALLATAFFYEALTRHPSISVVPFEEVQRAAGSTMKQTVDRLLADAEVEAVLVGALLELRPRLGDPREPYQRAGASLYAALIEVPRMAPVWKRVFDRSPPQANRARRQYHRLVDGEDPKALTAHEVAERGASRMVGSLIRAIH